MLAFRAGLHYSRSLGASTTPILIVPIEVSGLYLFHKNRHFIEWGSGLSYFQTELMGDRLMSLVLRIGYRLQKPRGGFFLKTGFTPMFDFYVENPKPHVRYRTWNWPPCLALGYTFR